MPVVEESIKNFVRTYLDFNYSLFFIKSHLALRKHKKLFDSGVVKRPLTYRQRISVILDEKRNLVVAGAGTGKTTTILAKVLYLIKDKKCKENEILLLAFSNAAEKELNDRLKAKAICTGEIIQTHQRRKFGISQEEYLQALSMKTGELFALSCEMGAYLSGASPTERASLRAFGMALGTAYQIYDDCLDLFGTELVAGKSLGTDLAGGKPTFPILAALKDLNRPERERLLERLENWSDEFFEETIELLHRSGVLNSAQRLIRNYLDQCVACLGGLTRNSEAATALRGVCEFLADQTVALGLEVGRVR